jgi:hypothetical protein
MNKNLFNDEAASFLSRDGASTRLSFARDYRELSPQWQEDAGPLEVGDGYLAGVA